MKAKILFGAVSLSLIAACASSTPPAKLAPPVATAQPESKPESLPTSDNQPKEATAETASLNASWLQKLPFSDRQDYEDAKKGFIATTSDIDLKRPDGYPVWNLKGYEFLQADQAPSTVNPSLWRIAQLNMNNGLFQVTDRVYQIRGFDLSNMTIIEGDTGLILIDPLISPETAKAGLDLYYQNRPQKPVKAVIYTHSHADHYGGVKGVVSEEDVKAGKVKILAPEGFLEEAASENVYAGTAMGRRAMYQYGPLLPRGPKGQVDAGLGKNTSNGITTLIAPTDTVKKTGETRLVDGVQMEFQMAPHTEAPAEMLIYFPQFRVLDAAEDATHTLHNLYTLRGAQVRDAKQWWKTLDEAIQRYGEKSDVVIAQHHWPIWDNARVVPYLESQRNLYKFLHDQTLNLANQGYTMIEIAEMLKLPDSIANKWPNRGYYGSVNHDAKAVYQRYLGWYDSNPSNLYAYPPEEAAKRFVDSMGGVEAVTKKAREYFDKGDYRWAATLMNNVAFADPGNQPALNFGADALEQLGYQTENPTWRNEFLMGAYELRNGLPKIPAANPASADVVKAMNPEMLLDYMGIRLDGAKADGKRLKINWNLSDSPERYAIELVDSVLVYRSGKPFATPDATLTMSKADFANVMMGGSTFDQETQAGRAKVEGDGAKVNELFGSLNNFNFMFNIVTP